MHAEQRNDSTTERPDADGAARSNGDRELASRTRRQLVLREVNERIRELAGEWNESPVSLFVCECSDLSCAEALEISPAEYARIRADESQFLVSPGHERPESERVVERTGRFLVVANREVADAQPPSSERRDDG